MKTTELQQKRLPVLMILGTSLIFILLLIVNLPLIEQLFANRISIQSDNVYSLDSFYDGLLVEISGTPNQLVTLKDNEHVISSFSEYAYDFMGIFDENYIPNEPLICIDATEAYATQMTVWKNSFNELSIQNSDVSIEIEETSAGTPPIPNSLLSQFTADFTDESRLLDCAISTNTLYETQDVFAVLLVQILIVSICIVVFSVTVQKLQARVTHQKGTVKRV